MKFRKIRMSTWQNLFLQLLENPYSSEASECHSIEIYNYNDTPVVRPGANKIHYQTTEA